MVAPSPFDLSRPSAKTHQESAYGQPSSAVSRSWRGRLHRLVAFPAALSLLLSLLLPVAVAVAQDDVEDAAGQEPAGDYTVAITDDDVPSDLVNGSDLIGRWQLSFRPDGTFSFRRADLGELVSGSYTVDAQTITLTDEVGLLSCVNARPTGGEGIPPETGTYGWELGTDGLTLQVIEDGCAGRRLLLSTRSLGFFVACETEAVRIPPPLVDGEEGTDDQDGGRTLDNPFGRDDEDGEEVEDDVEIDEDSAADGIDAVLGQLTACWSTQDPARILPLFGSEFLNALVEQAGSLYDVAGIFGQIMAIPITWERAGEIDLQGTTATCLVSQTIGAEESFVRFRFVFEDGEWKLASFG